MFLRNFFLSQWRYNSMNTATFLLKIHVIQNIILPTVLIINSVFIFGIHFSSSHMCILPCSLLYKSSFSFISVKGGAIDNVLQEPEITLGQYNLHSVLIFLHFMMAL